MRKFREYVEFRDAELSQVDESWAGRTWRRLKRKNKMALYGLPMAMVGGALSAPGQEFAKDVYNKNIRPALYGSQDGTGKPGAPAEETPGSFDLVVRSFARCGCLDQMTLSDAKGILADSCRVSRRVREEEGLPDLRFVPVEEAPLVRELCAALT